MITIIVFMCYIPLNLFATGQSDYQYQWTGPDGFTSTEQNPIWSEIALEAGVYSFTVDIISPNGCSGRGIIDVTITEGEGYTVGNNIQVCEGETINLSVAGGIDYFWQGPNDFINLTDSPIIENATSAQAGAYIVDIMTADGCFYKDSILVGVLSSEAIEIIMLNNPTCEGETLELTTNMTDANYEWIGPNGFTSSEPTLTIENATSELNGSYTLSIAMADCEGSGAIEVNIAPSVPTISPNIKNIDCDILGSIELPTTEAFIFNWADLEGTNNEQNRTDLEAGTYTVTISNESGCSQVLEGLVIEEICDRCIEPPVISEIKITNSTCNETNGTIDIELVQNPVNYTFSWDSEAGLSLSQFDSKRVNMPAGTYTITITDNRNDLCQLIETIVVESAEGPVITVLETTPTTCKTATGTATLTVGEYDYRWNDGGIGAERRDLAEGAYTITVTDDNGCMAIAELTIEAEGSITGTAQIDQQPSCGEANGVVSITITGGSGNYAYSWGDSNTRSDLVAGTYTVQISDNDLGCTTEVSFELEEVAVENILELGTAENLTLECGPSNLSQVQEWLTANANTNIIASNGTVSWSNNFSGTLPAACGEAVTIQFSATDECGGAAIVEATLQIIDTTEPQISAATSIQISCAENGMSGIDSWLAANGQATATEECSDLTWTHSFMEETSISCDAPISVTFTATDACGNASTTTATITLSDEEAPIFVNAPADITVSCNAIPAVDDPATLDNCDPEPSISLEETQDRPIHKCLWSNIMYICGGEGQQWYHFIALCKEHSSLDAKWLKLVYTNL